LAATSTSPISGVPRVAATILAVAALAGVAGCGGDDTDGATEGATPSTTATGGDDQGSPGEDGEGGAPSTTAPAGDGEDDQPVQGKLGGGGVPPTVEDAVARFEEFARAFGAGDVATSCAIGRVAVEADSGGMSCEEAVAFAVEMITEEELAALRTATVDRSLVVQTAPDRVEIPPAALDSTDPANVVMEHDGTDWFVVAG
jgi:hypothetical protein